MARSKLRVEFEQCQHLETDDVAHDVWTHMCEIHLLDDSGPGISVSTALPCPRCHYLGPETVAEVVRDWTVGMYDDGEWPGKSMSQTQRLVEIGWVLSVISNLKTLVAPMVHSTMTRQLAFVSVYVVQADLLPRVLSTAEFTLKNDAWRFHRACGQEVERREVWKTRSAAAKRQLERLALSGDSFRGSHDRMDYLLHRTNDNVMTITRDDLLRAVGELGHAMVAIDDASSSIQEFKAEAEVQGLDPRIQQPSVLRTLQKNIRLKRSQVDDDLATFESTLPGIEAAVAEPGSRKLLHHPDMTDNMAALRLAVDTLFQDSNALWIMTRYLDKAERELRVGILGGWLEEKTWVFQFEGEQEQPDDAEERT
jgi:hypothetical protein